MPVTLQRGLQMTSIRHRIRPEYICAAMLAASYSAACANSVLAAEPASAASEGIAAIQYRLMPPVVIKGRPVHYDQLAGQMQSLHVPAVSVAVIHHGTIEWARGFGVQSPGGLPVTPDTLFQAGSISKPLTALEVLHLVQQGKFGLDVDVNQYLRSWKVPTNVFTQTKPVTLRELLSHTAGVTVHGFAGYAAGQPLPSLIDVLNGVPPANSPPIRVDTVPGAIWRYSGGGYVIVEQLLEDTTSESFAKVMQDNVLRPLGMDHSTYEQPLPRRLLSRVALPYGADGVPVIGGPHVYPEQSAAGLWTTPSDLARFALGVTQDLAGQGNRVVSAATVRTMLTPGLGNWGLGLAVGGSTSRKFFTHGGADAGYQCVLAAYDDGRDGAVIMTDSDAGGFLAGEILRTLAYTYHWPDFSPPQHAVVQMDPGNFDRFVGYYQRGLFYFHIYLEGGHYYARITGQSPVEIFPESSSEFFATLVAAQISFDSNSGGKVTGLVLHQNGRDMPWQRVSTAIYAKAQQHIRDNKPSPGTGASLRRWIDSMQTHGHPNYGDMEPALAEVARQQAPQTVHIFQQLGTLQSLKFESVNPLGMDVYLGAFTHGQVELYIAPLDANGKVVARTWRVLQ
jgi:CubicO group peptidase (beta-lactamase class C family)